MKTNHRQVKEGLSESKPKPKNQPTTRFFENQPSTSSSSLLSVVVQGNDDDCLSATSESMSSSQQLTSPIADAFTRASAYSIGGLRHAKIVNCIFILFAKTIVHLPSLKEKGLKRLIHELSPLFKIPSVKHKTTTGIEV
nr:unnamed protein product [Callosobruchus chinensis]